MPEILILILLVTHMFGDNKEVKTRSKPIGTLADSTVENSMAHTTVVQNNKQNK